MRKSRALEGSATRAIQALEPFEQATNTRLLFFLSTAGIGRILEA